MLRNTQSGTWGRRGIFLLVFFFSLSCMLIAGNEASAAKKFNVIVKITGPTGAKSGVSVKLTNGTTKTAKTSKSGKAKFKKIKRGTYTITPSKSGYAYSPESREVKLSGKGTKTYKFTGALGVDSLSVDNNSVAIGEGESDEIIVTAKNKNGSGLSGQTITAASSNETVATVEPSSDSSDSNGEVAFTVTGEGEGTATLTFTSGTKTVTATVEVSAGTPGSLWVSSGHADYSAEAFNHWSSEDDDYTVSSSCAKCHSRDGFQDYIADGTVDSGVVISDSGKITVQVIDCATCHTTTAMDIDSVTFPSGEEIEGLGHEAICMTCHQGRESKTSVDSSIAGLDEDVVTSAVKFKNIHYFAAAVTLYGTQSKGGYEYDDKTYDGKFSHVTEADVCIECHDMHSLKVKVNLCAECHTGVTSVEDLKDIRMAASGTIDYDGDGNSTEGVYYEFDSVRTQLLSAIQNYATVTSTISIAYDGTSYPYYFVDTNGNGTKDSDETTSYNGWTPRLLKAAFNYQVAQKDPGAFAHNVKYMIELMYDSIEDLGGDVSGLTRNDFGHFDATAEAFRHWDEDGEVSANCTRCHAPSAGIDYYLANDFTNSPDEIVPSYGFPCETCHELEGFKDGTYSRRSVSKVIFPSTVTDTASVTIDNTVDDDSFICMTCHQGRESKSTIDDAIEKNTLYGTSLSFKNIHYLSAGATLYGSDARVGYEYDGKSYEGPFDHFGGSSKGVAAKCTYCHTATATDHTFVPKLTSTCMGCHPEATESDIETIRLDRSTDYNGNGNTTEKLKDEIATLRDALYAAIQDYADTTIGSKIVYNGSIYPYFIKDTNGNGEWDEGETSKYTAWDAKLLGAAQNYQMSNKEPGNWAHNTEYTVQLLYDSIEDLGGDVGSFNRP